MAPSTTTSTATTDLFLALDVDGDGVIKVTDLQAFCTGQVNAGRAGCDATQLVKALRLEHNGTSRVVFMQELADGAYDLAGVKGIQGTSIITSTAQASLGESATAAALPNSTTAARATPPTTPGSSKLGNGSDGTPAAAPTPGGESHDGTTATAPAVAITIVLVFVLTAAVAAIGFLYRWPSTRREHDAEIWMRTADRHRVRTPATAPRATTVSGSCCALRPRPTPSPGENCIPGVMYGFYCGLT